MAKKYYVTERNVPAKPRSKRLRAAGVSGGSVVVSSSADRQTPEEGVTPEELAAVRNDVSALQHDASAIHGELEDLDGTLTQEAAARAAADAELQAQIDNFHVDVDAGVSYIDINDAHINLAHNHCWSDIVNHPNYISHIIIGDNKVAYHYANGDVAITDFQPLVSRVADLENWRSGAGGIDTAIHDLQADVAELKVEKENTFIRFSAIVDDVTIEQTSYKWVEGSSDRHDVVMSADRRNVMLLVISGLTTKYYISWDSVPGILDRNKIDPLGDFFYMTDSTTLTVYHWHGDESTGSFKPTGNKITVDSALSDSSENPVQNKVIKAALDAIDTALGGKASSTDLTALATRVTALEGIESVVTIKYWGNALSPSVTPSEGDYWFDTTLLGGGLKRFNGSQWVSVTLDYKTAYLCGLTDHTGVYIYNGSGPQRVADETDLTSIETAISSLQTAVAGKADASAVTTLSGRVDDVEEDVSDLQNSINGIISDYATNASLNSEAAARQSADSTLDGKITAEQTARQTVDTHLQAQVDQLFNDTAVSAGEGYIDIGDNHIVLTHNHSWEDVKNAPDFLVGITVGEGRLEFTHRNGDVTNVDGLFNRVVATLDNVEGGQPSVSASCEDGQLVLAFHNLKGDVGPKGGTIVIEEGETLTLYYAPGQAEDGAMTQKAVTDFANTKVPKVNAETTQIADASDSIQVCDNDGNIVALIDASGVSAGAFVFRDTSGQVTGTFRVGDLLIWQSIAGSVKIREANALHVTDDEGNVAASVDENGVSSTAFNVKDNSGGLVGSYDSEMAVAMRNVRECVRMREKGLRITDGEGNYCVTVDARGVFDVKAIGSNLRSIITDITGGGSMPDYIKDEYSDTLLKVQSLQGSDTFSFGFITDLHFCNEDTTFDASTKTTLRRGIENAMAALARFSKEYPLATVAANGDYMQLPSTHTKQMGIDCLMDVNRWMSAVLCPNFALCGNHEYSYSGNPLDSSNLGLTRSEIYNYLSRRYVTSEVRKAAERVYYQIDDADGVVFVYITTTGACATLGVSIGDTGIEDDLKDGYDAIFAVNTNDYPYILISHYSNNLPSSGTAAQVNHNVGHTIDYFNASGTVLFYIGGHVHSDWALVHTSGGKSTLVVSCLQAGAWTNEQSQDGVTYSHVPGTATESAFSIFTVNRLTGKLHCTRFGLGRDRAINYNSTSGTVGAVTYSD